MYSIGIPTVLYKELLLIAEGKEENLLDEFLEKISSKETYLLDIVPDEARQHILHVKQKYGTLNLYQQINVDVGGKGYEKRI